MRSTLGRFAIATLCAALLCAAARPSAACDGDCRGEGEVSVDDLIRAVNIALTAAPVSVCEAADSDHDGEVTINELVVSVHHALEGCAFGPAGEVLINVNNSQLDEDDLATGAVTTIVPSTHARVSGQACLLPGGSGQFVVGEYPLGPAEQPSWAVFSADGTFLRRLPPLRSAGSEAVVENPFGCVVDAQGRLFGTAANADLIGPGHVVVYFPPEYTTGCVLESIPDGRPGQLAIDDAGNLYAPNSAFMTVVRFSGPFPSSAAECATVVPTQSTFITYDDTVPLMGVARAANGHVFVSTGVFNGDSSHTGIREHAADGAFIREIPTDGPRPGILSAQPLAFDSAGHLYYTDASTADTSVGQIATWAVHQIAFSATGEPSAPTLVASGTGDADGLAVFPSRAEEWLTLGGSLRRTYFNPRDRQINVDTVPKLKLKWRYMTSGLISAQPAVVWLDLPSEGRTQVVIVPSWDGNVYALRAENGRPLWRYAMKPQPGASYPYTSSPTVAWVDGQPRVFVGGGETMYCLDAASGAEIWQFDAGTGCTNCTARQERNEVEASPAVLDGLVIASMDVNDSTPGKGGMFALRADDGRLVWWFDPFTLSTCRPSPEDNVRRFDGFHTAEQLGLPEDFFTTRSGCDFDRTGNGCGNVWSSPAVDARRGMLYTVSGNCDTDDDPDTPAPPPPLPPLEEAIFALNLDGTPAWSWRPREIDTEDFDFGAVPNLFEATIGGEVRDLVGVGGKDGTFYVLDRDGVNALTGKIEPYWATNVVPGGFAGGFIGAASVGEGVIVGATAAGFDPVDPQRPIVHAFDPASGAVLWEYADVDATFAPTMGVPGLAITGSTPRPNLNFFTRDGGDLVRPLMASIVPGGIAGGPTLVGAQLFVGGGTGAFNSGSQAETEARRDTPLSAFCVEGTAGCATNTCDDGNACTYDYRDRSGACVSEPNVDGMDCRDGFTVGVCQSGACVFGTTP
jgi:outer membrane protein assembly factor BamB